ncbi:hypothetical protein K458DRAFT_365130 [Lentithecium fluviatile CBS 122367]|uniref:Uncharacterized protein n=1 Tax=Lentithecium fluviatile CBS 122367 TaxID=1168545 RepID=A0A6G1J5Z0_9PLEO|nr:hypothetical protein K458DRAFT_365130 [Lentithecium fluviatile CBS 122367]
MPFIRPLAAPGSPRRLFGYCAGLLTRSKPCRPPPITAFAPSRRRTTCVICRGIRSGAPSISRQDNGSLGWRPSEHPRSPSRYYSRHELPQTLTDISATVMGVDDGEDGHNTQGSEDPPPRVGFRAHRSNSARQTIRPSQPGLILEAIQNEARDLYTIAPHGRKDLSYTSRSSKIRRGTPPLSPTALPERRDPQPRGGIITLYSILARHIRTSTSTPGAESSPGLREEEITVLRSRGYSAVDVEKWSSCLLNPKSVAAAAIFKSDDHLPPLFLVSLFLRRKHMKMTALGIILRHIDARRQSEPIAWHTLQILIIRLLRHARIIWPQSIPWIAFFFSTEATRIFEEITRNRPGPPKFLREVTHFSNTMLSLISLPTSVHPLMDSVHQQKAQFQILQFMQSCDPAIVVTRDGFRAVMRNQLMHSKTRREKEWAALKGPSWPPWKEARTAMDEDKGYEFGASRASRILHRMYEAGYDSHTWEEVAQIYAGWDTDLSPTIQTRTTLPRFSTQYSDQAMLKTLLWAGRIRTTRSQREAWACFLAYEASGAPTAPEVYFAMFEKLHYPEVDAHAAAQQDPSKSGEDEKRGLLPGDMREVQPDPKSPLHLVHLGEMIPTYDQLFHRMTEKGLRPSTGLLAFLVETIPDFSAVLRLLEAHKGDFNGGVAMLLTGRLSEKSPVPGYFLGAFITFLCRFGRFAHAPATKPISISPHDHEVRFRMEKHYLVEYAYVLLTHYRPNHRPAWTTYMRKVLFDHTSGVQKATQANFQYTIMCTLLEQLEAIDVDPDDEQFRLFCQVARFVGQAAFNGDFADGQARHIVSTAPRLLRTIFHTMVAANGDVNDTSLVGTALTPHVPDPAVLHAYVRALGTLRDYEGLYSFSTWARANHAAVTARANAQRSGSRALYRAFVALRAALDGSLSNDREGAPEDLAALIREQIESVEEWGWPRDEHVDMYVNKVLWGSTGGPRAVGFEKG